jgi:hypothetical protein
MLKMMWQRKILDLNFYNLLKSYDKVCAIMIWDVSFGQN